MNDGGATIEFFTNGHSFHHGFLGIEFLQNLGFRGVDIGDPKALHHLGNERKRVPPGFHVGLIFGLFKILENIQNRHPQIGGDVGKRPTHFHGRFGEAVFHEARGIDLPGDLFWDIPIHFCVFSFLILLNPAFSRIVFRFKSASMAIHIWAFDL